MTTPHISAGEYRARLRAKQPETAVQRELLDWFDRACPNALVFAVPNGERRDAKTGAKLKGQGVLAGAPDLVFAHNGVIAFIEVKKPSGGRLSPAQKRFQEKCAEERLPYAVVRGTADLAAFLRDIGVTVREAA